VCSRSPMEEAVMAPRKSALGTTEFAQLIGAPRATVRTWSTRKIDGVPILHPNMAAGRDRIGTEGEWRNFSLIDVCIGQIMVQLVSFGMAARFAKTIAVKLSADYTGVITAKFFEKHGQNDKAGHPHCSYLVAIENNSPVIYKYHPNDLLSGDLKSINFGVCILLRLDILAEELIAKIDPAIMVDLFEGMQDHLLQARDSLVKIFGLVPQDSAQED
jgi:hypothetical protein